MRKFLYVVAISAVIVAILMPIKIVPYIESKTNLNFDSYGVIGDFLGGSTTPLLNFASFIMVIVAILLQREELKLQRGELSETRKEFKIQNATLARQRFENTFFQMIALHHQIVSGFQFTIFEEQFVSNSFKKIPVEYKGRECLKYIVSNYSMVNNETYWDDSRYQRVFESLYNEHQDILGHYFRNLYHIVKFIDVSDELNKFDNNGLIIEKDTFEEKMRYIRIIRAQLSTNELVLLFYNSLSEDGENFYNLIKIYKVLHNLKVEVLPNAMHKKFMEMGQS